MPYESAMIAAAEFRAALLRRERAAAVRLVRAYGAVYQRLQGQIAALTADLQEIAASGEITPWKVGRLQRLKGLRTQIAEEVTRYAAVVESEIDAGAIESIRAGLADAQALTQASLPGLAPIDAQIMANWQRLNPEAVRSLLGFLADDSPLRTALRERLGEATADVVASHLVEGIALGYNPRKVTQIIRRSLGEGLTWSLTSTRTAQLYAYRDATRAAYVANSEIVPRWRWQSARDSRTCMACIAMDGTVHPASEILNDHHCGRCVATPVTITYRDLGFDVDEPPPPPGPRTGAEWFASLPEAQQRAQMGPEFHKAWRAGKFDLADFPATYQDDVYGEMRRAATLEELTQHATAAA